MEIIAESQQVKDLEDTGRFFWFSYHAAPRDTRHLSKLDDPALSPYCFDLHQLRDGAAFAELSRVVSQKYQYACPLLNLPGSLLKKAPKNVKLEVAKKEVYSFLRPSDLLVLCTRPPLDDDRMREEARVKKVIEQSGTWLEGQVFRTLKESFFDHCDRSQVMVKESLGVKIREFDFGQRIGAWNLDIPITESVRETIGFLIATPLSGPDWSDAPYLITAFSMGGLETLVWCRILATRLRELLEQVVGSHPKKRFVMAKIQIPITEIKKTSASIILLQPPVDLSFIEGCVVRDVVDRELP